MQAARLQARLGRVEVEDSISTGASRATVCYDAAVGAFEAAEQLLGDCNEELDEEQSDLWLEVQVDGRANLHYWWNEPERGAEVLAKARPLLEGERIAHPQSGLLPPPRKPTGPGRPATASTRKCSRTLGLDCQLQKRAASSTTWPIAVLILGELLLWHGDLVEAQEKLEGSRAIWERIGDPLFPLSRLNLAALRRHDVEAVRSLSGQVLTLAEAAEDHIHVTLAKASMAWVAWRDGRPADVVAIASEALELWDATAVSYPCKLLCLWPLIAVRLSAGQIAEAVDASRQLLMPPQIRFPDELESLLEWVVAKWDGGERDLAARRLADALELAERLGYA